MWELARNIQGVFTMAFFCLIDKLHPSSFRQWLKCRKIKSVDFIICSLEEVCFKRKFDLLDASRPSLETDFIPQIRHVLDVLAVPGAVEVVEEGVF